MNKNINTFNLWATDGRDEKMEKNHLDSVNEMITIIEENSNNLESPLYSSSVFSLLIIVSALPFLSDFPILIISVFKRIFEEPSISFTEGNFLISF